MALPIDPWAQKWLDGEREKGRKGLTIEKRKDGHHYVIWATTHWVPETKKRRKESEYLGRLMSDGSLVKDWKKGNKITARSVRQEGSALLLKKATDGLLEPLREYFPGTWEHLIIMAWSRLTGSGTLKNAGREWERLENVLGITASVNPKALSGSLKAAGSDPASQIMFGRSLPSAGGEMTVDLSVCFSRSKGAVLLKRGYNRFALRYPQFKVLLVCSSDTGAPAALLPIPGNLTEGTLASAAAQIGLGGRTAVLDRGFAGSPLLDELDAAGADYVVAMDRNSVLYPQVKPGREEFVWMGRAIRSGRTEINGRWYYRFEDPLMKNDEKVDSLGSGSRADDDRSGNILICSNRFMDNEKAYLMYKHRQAAEEFFDSGKNVLNMDRTYMHDDEGIMGHVFVTFLAMRIRSWIADKIREAGLTPKYSPEDVILMYSSVFRIRSPDIEIRFDTPADVMALDRELKIHLYQ